ncbi:MAG TPA: AI-2E family transporter [Nocardioides sp.]|jgi:predicted PurR-regulated permease PerM|nr:AI-2E family transporter [Nocardioides sp.]
MSDTDGPSDRPADGAPDRRTDGGTDPADDREPEQAAVRTQEPDAGDERAFLHDPDQRPDDLGEPGRPLNSRSPFMWGLFGGLGALVALWIGLIVMRVSGVIVLVVVAMFLAVGLNPAVEFLMRRGMRRPYAVLVVISCVVLVFAGFLTLLVPIISHQVTEISNSLPGWFDKLQRNDDIRRFDQKYDITHKVEDYVRSGGLAEKAFGGVVGVGLAILGILLNAFVVVVLTLYFLGSLPTIKRAAYSLAPASRRDRVSLLGDRILRNVGGYVSGAFVVAFCAGLSTLIFLFIVGLGGYAVALAMVVALLDVIPMIGATIGAVIVCAIAFATDFKTGVVAVIFYIAYQQLENYVIYPRVMSRSVEIPGALTVIAALIGATLLGVVGALLAIPTAASILLLVKEVFLPRQEAR